MRKVLPILLAIAIAAPTWANVTVSVSEGAANDEIAELNLAIDGGSVVRGLALKVTITGANLAAVADVTNVMSAFNAYIDYYYSNPGFLGSLPNETALPGTGAHALANPDAAGVLSTLPATTFVISLGALDNSGNQGGVAAGGLLAKIKLSNFTGSSAQVCIEPDALRGGIVGDSLGTVSAAGCASIAKYVSPECVKSTAPFYAAWVQFGKPNCWCYARNCKGDADGKSQSSKSGTWWVGTNDLNVLLSAWQVLEPPAGPGILSKPNGICADFARDAQSSKSGTWRVGTNDLNILLANWQKLEPPAGSGIGDCSGANYNFFVTPN